MEIIKGASAKFVNTVYIDNGKTLANLVGATVKLLIKKRDVDSDAEALINKNGTITDTTNSVCEVTLLASESNGLNYPKLVYEIIVKLADGTFIRSGVNDLIVKANVLKTLF